jgi:ribonuclease HI
MNKLPVVTIYTDGACVPNPGAGGWAALLKWEDGHEKELTGAENDTTNNRMELTAIIQALKALENRHTVELFSDSQYCGKIMTGGKALVNKDLVRELYELIDQHKVYFTWKKRDSDSTIIKVDLMAKAAINKQPHKAHMRSLTHVLAYSGNK